MILERVYIILSFIIVVFIDVMIGIDKGFSYTLFGLILLTVESSIHFRNKSALRKKDNIIVRLRSNEWIGGLFIAFFLIYSLLDEKWVWDAYDYLATTLILFFGFLYAIRNRTIVYIFNDEGILGLADRKRIKKFLMEKIDISAQRVSFHTKSYRNHLIIESTKILKPEWTEFLQKIKILRERWELNKEKI
ncbi:MAG: hypothetical protein RJQ09_01570 [Cyclobacteriaceae bacterium]